MYNLLTLLMAPGGGGGTSQLMMIMLIIIVFYFFMIRPQSKKAKNERLFKESLKKGDKVVTNGGIHGRIAELNDTNLILEVEGGNRLKIEKWAIAMEASAALQKEQQ